MSGKIGLYGLGTMGRALALNLAEKGASLVVGNRSPEKVGNLVKEATDLGLAVEGSRELTDFVASLTPPRVVLLMVPSGGPVDSMISQLIPLLEAGDMIVDAGNSDFHDTRRRSADLEARSIGFIGMGVSGGEYGARHGPSMMVGCDPDHWSMLRPILERIAAKYEGNPCVAHLGRNGAGHFVKTVHNGIEYADMQILAEIYGLLHHGSAWTPPEIATLFERWNGGRLQSFLMEVSANVLHAQDPETGHPLINVIVDQAGQKGTGRWTLIEALRMGQSASAIEAAVGARSWSADKNLRELVQSVYGGELHALNASLEEFEAAVYAARMIAHIQGFEILRAASSQYEWGLDLRRIAEIWRAGCIIRSDMLNTFVRALSNDETPLLVSPVIAEILGPATNSLRTVTSEAMVCGHPVPALSAALSWFDTMRQRRGTTNLIQAQRDYFGRHGFERLGRSGVFHGPWDH